MIPDETVPLEKGYYHGVHVLIHFNKYNCGASKEEQSYVEPDPDWEEMKDIRL